MFYILHHTIKYMQHTYKSDFTNPVAWLQNWISHLHEHATELDWIRIRFLQRTASKKG